MRIKSGYIYIITNRRNGTLYTGVTGNLSKRIYEHKHKIRNGFSKDHRLERLVYFEGPMRIHAAIKREKQVKKWRRKWKLELIEQANPNWKDLYSEIYNPIESDFEAIS